VKAFIHKLQIYLAMATIRKTPSYIIPSSMVRASRSGESKTVDHTTSNDLTATQLRKQTQVKRNQDFSFKTPRFHLPPPKMHSQAT
jgi:hypothetical protein